MSSNIGTDFKSEQQEGIVESLKNHQMWLQNPQEGAPANFMHIDFSDFDFSDFDMSKVIFKHCNLTNTKFQADKINSSEFHHCDLTKASFVVNYINDVKFESSTISSSFLNAHFVKTVFKKCSATDLNISKAKIESCLFEDNKFYNVDFNSAQFTKCSFTWCSFAMSDFAYSTFNQCMFQNISFLGTDMHSVYLKLCNFVHTKFKSYEDKSYNFIKTSLKNITFEDCNFVKCAFEEKKEFLAKSIVKNLNYNKQHSSKKYKICFIGLKFISTSLLLSIILLILKKKISPISSLSLAILSSTAIYCKMMILERINSFTKRFTLNFNTINAFIFLTIIIFFTNWLYSLRYNNFQLSLALLALFFISIINIIDLFHNANKLMTKKDL